VRSPGADTGLARAVRREFSRIGAHGPMPYALAISGGVVWRLLNQVMECYSATPCSF